MLTHTCRWRRFILRNRAQVLEVLTKYGEICEASFDMDFPAIADEDMEDTFMLARQLAPNTLFRGRGMGGKREDGGYGDYDGSYGDYDYGSYDYGSYSGGYGGGFSDYGY